MGAVSFSLDGALATCLRDALNLEVFVETGTFRGDTAEAMAALFAEVHTIEISQPWHAEARARLARFAHVHVIHGDSPQELRRLAPVLAHRPALFFLDAHWCAVEDSGGGQSQCPLLEELAAIGLLGGQSAIIIDDARLFLAPPPPPHAAAQWPELSDILRAIGRIAPDHRIAVINDMVIVFPAAAAAAVRRYGLDRGLDWLAAARSLEEARPLLLQLEEKERVLQHQGALLAGQAQAIEEKDRALRELTAALNAYRAASALDVVLRPLLKGARRLKAILRPRLGTLCQHAPRPLDLPKEYAKPMDVARAPTISLVTPAFNQSRFIERTLRSVLEQNYPRLEYFVQDGGSRDGTVEILRRYEGRLSGWESRPDGGQSHAVNLGFAKTTGEIMGWLNSDDLLLPGALGHVADYFRRHPEVDVVYGHRILIDENDQQIGRWMLPAHDDGVLSWADYVPQETLFWRRRIWEKAGGRVDESFRFAMDWDLLIRFREAGARFVRLPRFLGAFRVHPQQKTSAAISDVGHQEMARIRQRVLGRPVTREEIRRAVLPYLLRHVATDLGFRIRRRLEYSP